VASPKGGRRNARKGTGRSRLEGRAIPVRSKHAPVHAPTVRTRGAPGHGAVIQKASSRGNSSSRSVY
jgi:hypothetical protein